MWNNSSSCSNTHSCRNRWAHHPRCHGHFNDSDASFVAPKGEKSSVVEKLFIADEIIVCYSVSCRSLTMYWSVAARLHNPFLRKVKRCMCFTGPLVTISQIHSRVDRNREAVKHSHHTERQKKRLLLFTANVQNNFSQIVGNLMNICWYIFIAFQGPGCKNKPNLRRQPTVDGKILRDDVWNVPDSEDLVAEKENFFISFLLLNLEGFIRENHLLKEGEI